MNRDELLEARGRLEAFVQPLWPLMGRSERRRWGAFYVQGLLLEGGRKTAAGMAQRYRGDVQALQQFVNQSPWDWRAIRRELARQMLTATSPRGAWILDDTGFPKKGRHSVGVARQYCGQLGKQDNCQVAVSLSVANDAASLPIAYRLYLPQAWADDPDRRKQAKVPADVAFATKPQIALEQIETAKAQGVAPGVILAVAGYGADGGFRAGLSGLDLIYVVGVQPTLSVWRPGEDPSPPKPWSGRGRPPSLMRRSPEHKPISAKALAGELAAQAWRTVRWREGTNAELSSRFAALRLRPASRDYNLPEPRAEEWLLIEWPEGESEPTKYWLSTLGADMLIDQLVDIAKLRWRIERDYQDLKQELGLGHYEGRGWRGFHHHASLCIAAYGLLISLRETIPPSTPSQAKGRPEPGLPQGHRPRGAPDPTRTTRPQLDRNPPTTADARPRKTSSTMSMLRQVHGPYQTIAQFMTQ
ncbi:MAG: IS701 family transposase [Candidatus Woesebacteria bacterium]|nr:IS701 family transposase [Candidatus Woesebacteria bacterium]